MREISTKETEVLKVRFEKAAREELGFSSSEVRRYGQGFDNTHVNRMWDGFLLAARIGMSSSDKPLGYVRIKKDNEGSPFIVSFSGIPEKGYSPVILDPGCIPEVDD